jgi:hypothetical protein
VNRGIGLQACTGLNEHAKQACASILHPNRYRDQSRLGLIFGRKAPDNRSDSECVSVGKCL